MQILTELSSRFISYCKTVRSVVTRDLQNRKIIYLNRPAGKTYVVTKGYVRLVYARPDGTTPTRMLLGKGAMFGDLPFRPVSFLSNEQATASGPTCLLEIERLELEKHVLATPDFQTLMLQTVSAQLQFLERRLRWQLVSPLRSRITTALVDLICFTGGRCGHGHLIDVRLTHEEFADLVVAARPVVTKILGELKADGIIDYTRSHLCLLDLDRLQSISETDEVG
ncbi:hypothetical protein B7486_42330 [cyanobacterium TDX16]|nr:hypothetical protein B7486_42330 [cyanobacterium TDX16]